MSPKVSLDRWRAWEGLVGGEEVDDTALVECLVDPQVVREMRLEEWVKTVRPG